jgi:hypothetical protein
MTAAQRRIREEARKQLEEEQRLKEAEEAKKPSDPRDGFYEFEHSEQISTLLYTCDLFNNTKVLPKKEVGILSTSRFIAF